MKNVHTVKTENLTKLAEYEAKLRREPKLRYLFFELTDACNMACLHCGSSASPCNKMYMRYELADKVMTDVAKAYDPSEIMICLTGGEPMLHPDFYRIAARAKELGFLCGITTNGTMIDEAAAEKIRDSGITAISVSLDGTEDLHDWFRNSKGAYSRAVRGVKNLVAASEGKMVVQITTVVHKGNIGELDRIYEAVLETGVESWRIANLDPIGRAQEHSELLLDGADHRYLLDYIKDKRFSRDVPIHVTYGCSHYLGIEDENMTRDFYFMCGSGIFVASVLCNGDIYSCLDIERRPEFVQGNVERDDFVTVWENGFECFRRDRTADCGDCRSCSERGFCRGDSAHTWNYDENRPMLCYKTIMK